MVILTIEQCNKWRSKPNVNPLTGKAIKTDGPTWKALFKACVEVMKVVPCEHVVYVADGNLESIKGYGVVCCVDSAEDATVIVTSYGNAFIASHGKSKHIMTLVQLQALASHVTWKSDDADSRGEKSVAPCAIPPVDRVLAVCLNNEDPVTFESWSEMSTSEIENVVMLSSETPGKKYCLTLDTAFNIYKTAVESGKPERARNPIASDRPFTEDEVHDILTKMKVLNPSFTPPAQVMPVLRPGIELVIQDVIVHVYGYPLHFVHISVVDSTRVGRGHLLIDFGTVPGWVETTDIGSADYTSGVLLANLWTLWSQRKFFTRYQEPYTKDACAVTRLISKKPLTPASWFSRRSGGFANQAFIELCQEVNDLVNA